MMGILGIISVILGIVFIVLSVMIWKNKNYTVFKKSILNLILLIVLIALVYGSFAVVLITSDHASYYSTGGQNLGDIEYDEILLSAENAGYLVEGPYFVNVKVQDATGLYSPEILEAKEQFGDEYLLNYVTHYYTQDSLMEIMFFDEDETSVVFFNYSRPDPYFSLFREEHLPDNSWIVDRFMHTYEIDSQIAGNYLELLKDNIQDENEPKISINIPVYPQSIYNDLSERSTTSNISPTHGEGFATQSFYLNNEMIGKMNFIVPNHEINYRVDGARYTVKLDKLGGMDLSIRAGTGERIPEEEYREVFREMLTNMGLPPESLDEFEFNYSPSMW
ncbi:conserved hypothetical protein [Methanosalsum zhilinae DSM 4017]|uniref:Uncharacterized protein n=1 Tax=Methanosalsum zhilinae (strain DSM 4017 / NBRC 107636 / OCM 62 / WeN5) TaxID=679901 RepID=F7XPF0_METZD|nr:hypothetical protein [Methanosalsum zhilinae]AEH60278.1 conserved hypothetical protein [Methanosalsum zhilinae DSM 4017]